MIFWEHESSQKAFRKSISKSRWPTLFENTKNIYLENSIFFFPPIIIIGHGYKYDWCGWATLRTKEMAKMFWFSSSSDLCSFLSRIWSGILILYYHACRQLFWIPEKVQFEEVAHLFEKNLIKCPCIPMGKNVMVFWLLKWYSILIYFLTHNSGSGWRWFDQSHDGID